MWRKRKIYNGRSTATIIRKRKEQNVGANIGSPFDVLNLVKKAVNLYLLKI